MNANQLREQLLSFTSKPVAVPGQPGLFVRIPGYKDSLRIESLVAKHSEGLGPEEKNQLHTGFMLAHCLCDEAGERVFGAESELDAAKQATSMFAPLAFSLIEFIVETISERKRELGKALPPAQQPSG